MDIAALFQQPNALPTAPKVVQDLISSFNDEKISAEAIARKLAADPVLSAKLLRLANSAYYHASHTISTVNEAVAMLGFVTVRTLVISSGLVNGFKSAPGLDLKQFWRYSLNTAVTAKWLARHLEENSDLAFTLGMTHAIGQLVIHAGMPEQAMTLDKDVPPLDARRLEVERKAFGYDYAAVGAELASRWKFPEIFSALIGTCQEPMQTTPFQPMAGILHLSAWFARAVENRLTTQESKASFPAEVASALGISPALMLEEMPSLTELSAGLEELIT